MVFTTECMWCKKPTVFDDSEQLSVLRLCMDCWGEWQDMKLMNDIMEGKYNDWFERKEQFDNQDP